MNALAKIVLLAALLAFGHGLGSTARANPHLPTCLDPGVSPGTMADFCRRALDFGFLSETEEAAAMTNIGVALSELDRHRDALAAYDRAAARHPDFFAIYPNRALARERLGRVKGALEDYETALRLRPRDVGSLIGRGALYLKRGVADLALADFEAAVSVDPNSLNAQYNRGLALLELGRNREAVAAFDAALRIDPGDARAFLRRGIARETEDPAAAARDFAEAMALRPDWPLPYVARGRMRDAAGDREGANADYRRAFDLGHQAEWLNERIEDIVR